ncbi:translation initiation factor 2 [Dactylosporangium sp. NPDC049140]|uniref:translation initiation factor 2 n=1 Tax=Dactylosporangium sp. NPDC049140 TaxID=3155647 RepID=UPI0033F44B1D
MSDDAFWRRPAEGSETAPPPPPAPPASVPYTGAPRSTPPPHGWRPPVVETPAPPRTLPAQDGERIDREEQAATILTKGMGIFAGAVMLVLLLILCGRVLF